MFTHDCFNYYPRILLHNGNLIPTTIYAYLRDRIYLRRQVTSYDYTLRLRGFLETLLRAWYGRRRHGAVETLGDLFVERDSDSKILPRNNHTTQGTQTEKKIK